MSVMKWFFKELVVMIFLISILSYGINWMRQPKYSSSILPEQTVSLLDGSSFRLKKGKPVIIHFWATWCHVCKIETANIEYVSQKYDMLTVVVNSGDDMKVKDYIQKKGISFKVLNDKDSAWATKFDVKAFPTTFIYDSKGILRFVEVGYTTTAGLLLRLKMLE